MGSLNALLLSKNNFEGFWENYINIMPQKIVNITSKLCEKTSLYNFFPKSIPGCSYIDNSLSKLYGLYSGNSLKFDAWDSFIDNQIHAWYTAEKTIPFSIINKTEIFELNDDIKKNIQKII